MRVQSERPCKPEVGGWIHSLDGKQVTLPPRQELANALSPEALLELHSRCLRALWSPSRATLREVVSRIPGVTANSLELLQAGWYEPWGCLTFPMFNADRKVVGLRTRHRDGAKRAIPGSHQGVFLPPWHRTGPLLIVEGPTDTAAVLTLGLDVMGRPSATGAVETICALAKGRAIVAVLGDRDTPKTRPDGSVWFPGQEGAAELVKALRASGSDARWFLPPPGVKDARQWVVTGAKAYDVMMAWAEADDGEEDQAHG